MVFHIYLLWRNICSSSLPIFNQVFCCFRSCLCILDIWFTVIVLAPLAFLLKIIWLYTPGFIFELSVQFHWFLCLSLCVVPCFFYYCLCSNFETRKCESFNFVFFWRFFGSSGFLEISYDFRIGIPFLQKFSLKFWQRLLWICRSLWVVLTF